MKIEVKIGENCIKVRIQPPEGFYIASCNYSLDGNLKT